MFTMKRRIHNRHLYNDVGAYRKIQGIAGVSPRGSTPLMSWSTKQEEKRGDICITA